MTNEKVNIKKIHLGRNIKKLRQYKNISQDYLAEKMQTTQQYISKLENKVEIDDETLEKLAIILDTPVNTIKEMVDDSPINYYNTLHDNATLNGANSNNENITYRIHTHSINKFIEVYEKQLKDMKNSFAQQMEEQKKLYERMLNDKEETIKKLNEKVK